MIHNRSHSRLQMASGVAMRQVQSISPLQDIVHPTYPKCARRSGSLELRRMELVGSTLPLSAKLAKTKRLMSYGGPP